jgi:hypothetical protein
VATGEESHAVRATAIRLFLDMGGSASAPSSASDSCGWARRSRPAEGPATEVRLRSHQIDIDSLVEVMQRIGHCLTEFVGFVELSDRAIDVLHTDLLSPYVDCGGRLPDPWATEWKFAGAVQRIRVKENRWRQARMWCSGEVDEQRW